MYLVILFASLLIFLAVALSFFSSRYFSLFHPFTLYCLFHGLVFVIRPFFSYWLEYEAIYQAYQFTPSFSDKITVIAAANLGFLSFAFFCSRHGAVEMRFRSDPQSAIERGKMARRFPLVMMICGPIAVWSLLSHYTSAASFSTLDTMGHDKASGVIYNTQGSGYFTEAQMMLVPLTALCAWLFRFRLIALLPLATFVILRAATGGRGPFVAAVFAAGLLFLYDQRRRFPTLRVTMVLAAVALLFTTIGSDRGQSLRAWFGEQTDVRRLNSDDLKFMEGMDFANLEFFEYIVYVVPQRSHTYGYFNDVLQVFTEPIPRVLWKNKPFGAPFERFSLFDYGYPVGSTRSLPGNGWYALGWVGVVINCGLWGYLLGLIYGRFAQGSQTTLQVAAYMVFLPILIVAYRDGSLVTVFRQGIFFAFPVILWRQFYLLRKSPQEQPPQTGQRGSSGTTNQRTIQGSPTHGQLPMAVLRRRARLMEQRSELSTQEGR